MVVEELTIEIDLDSALASVRDGFEIVQVAPVVGLPAERAIESEMLVEGHHCLAGPWPVLTIEFASIEALVRQPALQMLDEVGLRARIDGIRCDG